MTTQHTQGRLRVPDDGSIGSIQTESGMAIGQTFQTRPIRGAEDNEERKANARRLVAAWNYAQTLVMSTEELELAEQRIYSRRKLEAERNELLEALKRIEGATMSMYATRSDMLEDCQDIARAAIAKVEGKQ